MPKPRANRSHQPEFQDADPLAGWNLIERVLASRLVDRAYLWGPPGTGKTYAAYRKGRIGSGVYAITLTQETPASELRGHYLPKGSEVVWHDGPVLRAMRAGARLVINEASHASDDALAFLYPILEFHETARITLPSGETVTPAPGFNVVVTDNSPPDDLPEALRDRFDVTIEVKEPHPEALAALAEPLREAARRSLALEPERRVSLRRWLVLDRLRHELGLATACVAVFGAERGPQIHDAILLAGAR
jgi:MoxR-like ATPase